MLQQMLLLHHHHGSNHHQCSEPPSCFFSNISFGSRNIDQLIQRFVAKLVHPRNTIGGLLDDRPMHDIEAICTSLDDLALNADTTNISSFEQLPHLREFVHET